MPYKIIVTKETSNMATAPTDEEQRVGLEVRAHDQGIDPEGKSDEELTELVEEAELKAKLAASEGRQPANPDLAKPAKGKAANTMFYRSTVANLRLGNDGPTTKSERFTAYMERYQGDDVRVGYLATDSAYVQQVASHDASVEVITEDEYRKATQGKDARLIG